MSLRYLLPAVAAAILVTPAFAQEEAGTPVDAAAETRATFPATALAEKTFAYPSGIPYQVDTEPELMRGRQWGYNICNSTTEGQESLCQTSFFNSLDDFCLWGPPEPNAMIGDSEGEGVAWCTKPGKGTRLIPEGTFKGLQYIKTSDYIQVAGFIDQTKINVAAGDYGGEFDPHGADLRGNPLGGIMYSNAWSGGGENYQQVIEWSYFVGSDFFCFKACDPAGANDDKYCEHIYDRIGCNYNMPNQAKEGVFESCQGENQDYPGEYLENGVTMTYTQPGEGIAPEPTYTPRMPGSSECVTHTSSVLFAALASVGAGEGGAKPTGSDGAPEPTGAPTGPGANTSGGSTPRPTNGGNANSNSPPNANDDSTTEGAATHLTISAFSLMAVALSALFFS